MKDSRESRVPSQAGSAGMAVGISKSGTASAKDERNARLLGFLSTAATLVDDWNAAIETEKVSLPQAAATKFIDRLITLMGVGLRLFPAQREMAAAVQALAAQLGFTVEITPIQQGSERKQ